MIDVTKLTSTLCPWKSQVIASMLPTELKELEDLAIEYNYVVVSTYPDYNYDTLVVSNMYGANDASAAQFSGYTVISSWAILDCVVDLA